MPEFAEPFSSKGPQLLVRPGLGPADRPRARLRCRVPPRSPADGKRRDQLAASRRRCRPRPMPFSACLTPSSGWCSNQTVGRTFPDSRASRSGFSSITMALGYDHGRHGNGPVPGPGIPGHFDGCDGMAALELDHLFVRADAGGPEAERLVAFGLTEGAPNIHPGQSATCRRFFRNAHLEPVWVRDEAGARGEPGGPTGIRSR